MYTLHGFACKTQNILHPVAPVQAQLEQTHAATLKVSSEEGRCGGGGGSIVH